jgi:signal transduction histidine kinase
LRQPWILEPTRTSRSVLRGLVVLRWGTWVWAAIATVLADERVARPWLAAALLGAALAVNVATTIERRVPAIVELAVGFALLAGEGWVFESGHAFGGYQGLAGGWPVVGVIAAGITLGPWPAAIGGALVGTGRIVGVVANGISSLDATQVASLASTILFYALYGAAAGWVGKLLARAEREVGAARARDEVARTLHDGVLQTLAVVERRLGDREPDVARLVRDTERELRLSIEAPAGEGGDLRSALRLAVARPARLHDLDVEVVTIESIALDGDRLAALETSVAEAVMNVGKHSGVRRAVVFAQRRDDGSTFVSVKDAGSGFDVDGTPGGFGLRSSVRAPVEAVGGGAQVHSVVGEGTEVRLWVP